MRDEEVIAAADGAGMAMVFTDVQPLPPLGGDPDQSLVPGGPCAPPCVSGPEDSGPSAPSLDGAVFVLGGCGCSPVALGPPGGGAALGCGELPEGWFSPCALARDRRERWCGPAARIC